MYDTTIYGVFGVTADNDDRFLAAFATEEAAKAQIPLLRLGLKHDGYVFVDMVVEAIPVRR